MKEFYIKDKDQYIPVNVNQIIDYKMNHSVVVVRIGNDANPATADDIEIAAKSFEQADVLQDLDISLILTPFEIDIGTVEDKDEIDKKHLYLQITRGDNISELDESSKSLYKKLQKRYNTVLLPSPFTFDDYKKMKDILLRCDMRKNRRRNRKLDA